MANIWQNLAGTVTGFLRLGKDGVRLKESGGSLSVRNSIDSLDAVVLPQSLGTGVRNGTNFLRDDGTWQAAGGGFTMENTLSANTIIASNTSAVVVGVLELNGFQLEIAGRLGLI